MTKPIAAASAPEDVPVVVEPVGHIEWVTAARADALEAAGEGRRASDLDLDIAGVAKR